MTDAQRAAEFSLQEQIEAVEFRTKDWEGADLCQRDISRLWALRAAAATLRTLAAPVAHTQASSGDAAEALARAIIEGQAKRIAALEQERRIPREPTEAMTNAGAKAIDEPSVAAIYAVQRCIDADKCWRAMYDAAQEPASGGKT